MGVNQGEIGMRATPPCLLDNSGGTIHVVIGPVIDSHGKTAEQINQQAETWINQTMTRLEAEAAAQS